MTIVDFILAVAIVGTVVIGLALGRGPHSPHRGRSDWVEPVPAAAVRRLIQRLDAERAVDPGRQS